MRRWTVGLMALAAIVSVGCDMGDEVATAPMLDEPAPESLVVDVEEEIRRRMPPDCHYCPEWHELMKVREAKYGAANRRRRAALRAELEKDPVHRLTMADARAIDLLADSLDRNGKTTIFESAELGRLLRNASREARTRGLMKSGLIDEWRRQGAVDAILAAIRSRPPVFDSAWEAHFR